MVKDLVCGMMVDERHAAAQSEYKGKMYYFCSQGCKKAFDRDSEKYVRAESEEKTGHHHY